MKDVTAPFCHSRKEPLLRKMPIFHLPQSRALVPAGREGDIPGPEVGECDG